ncbi:MAG: BT4734/BF3469 family protein [Parabacteroides sp.]
MIATPSVSFFGKLYLSTSESFTLEEIIILIRTRRWIHEITAYRAALASGDKEAARSLKAQLPGFTPSGLFKGGHRANQLEAYSQVVGLDFDHVANLAALIALFLQQPFTLALFISPGGEGVKVFAGVDTGREEHAAAFAAVAAHYEHLSGVFCDRACKDISRCCYVSDDPEAYYNPEAQVFSLSSVVQSQVFVHDWLRAHPAVEGSRNQTVYRLGCEANRRGFDRNETAFFLHTPVTR